MYTQRTPFGRTTRTDGRLISTERESYPELPTHGPAAIRAPGELFPFREMPLVSMPVGALAKVVSENSHRSPVVLLRPEGRLDGGRSSLPRPHWLTWIKAFWQIQRLHPVCHKGCHLRRNTSTEQQHLLIRQFVTLRQTEFQNTLAIASVEMLMRLSVKSQLLPVRQHLVQRFLHTFANHMGSLRVHYLRKLRVVQIERKVRHYLAGDGIDRIGSFLTLSIVRFGNTYDVTNHTKEFNITQNRSAVRIADNIDTVNRQSARTVPDQIMAIARQVQTRIVIGLVVPKIIDRHPTVVNSDVHRTRKSKNRLYDRPIKLRTTRIPLKSDWGLTQSPSFGHLTLLKSPIRILLSIPSL